MFSLIGELVQYLIEPREYFILILGLDNAGKTCLLERLKFIQKPTYKPLAPEKLSPTIGLNVGRVDVPSGTEACSILHTHSARLIFWDLGGQDELQCLWEKYYKEAHGVVYVVDATDKARLRRSKDSFDKMVRSKALQGVPLLILTNKTDVEGAMTIPEIKKVFNESAGILGERACKVMGVSAITGMNLKEALQWLGAKVLENLDRPPVRQH
eukprot:m.341128 g.341128  ORF g.341128 m.341128 type:complete len:212 (+) comp19851_c0_seq1:239-874(+)